MLKLQLINNCQHQQQNKHKIQVKSGLKLVQKNPNNNKKKKCAISQDCQKLR